MPDMSAIAGLLQSINVAKTLGQGILAARDIETMSGKIIELNEKIIEAQKFIFSIQEDRAADVERINSLEKEVARLRSWDADKQRYELKQIAAGTLTYSLKPTMANGEPPHAHQHQTAPPETRRPPSDHGDGAAGDGSIERQENI